MLVLNVCFCNFLQMRIYNLFERHTRKRGRLKIRWRLFEPSVLCSETDTRLEKKEGAEAKRDERGGERLGVIAV